MDEKLLDPHQVLHYSNKKMNRRFLRLGLLAIGLGILIAWLFPPSGLYDRTMLVLCFVTGGPLTAYGLSRLFYPGTPLATLSPDGIACVSEARGPASSRGTRCAASSRPI